ncbi:MAG: c-type cytochrome [Piscinibacter sp.]|uniref:c-type cytochrome n=1 Tax=Piscinibacter TaxID=1114981 RepID=UPI000FDE3115|nr:MULTISPECIES: c-type cytochrome [Piscinibacter]MCW5664423.1 c-type cytochrome [Piscinibacter sp.]
MKKTVLGSLLIAALGAPAAQAAGSADDELVQRAVHVCATCHGDFGRSSDSRFPALAGQAREYTIRQLKDFRDKSRAETDVQAYMYGISALLTDGAIEGLADYYAKQEPRPGRAGSAALMSQGKAIFEKGLPALGVRACASCHGDRAEGQTGFPRLAGQHADYIVRQLKVFKTPLRPHGVIMKNEVRAMNEAQMKAVAAYLQSL